MKKSNAIIDLEIMITKKTSELLPGDKVRLHASGGPLNHCLGYGENPGHVVTVDSVEPWMLTAGPKAGQQAREGRGKNSPLLFTVNVHPIVNGRPCAPLDRLWVMAGVHNECTSSNPLECTMPLHDHIEGDSDSENYGKPKLCEGCDKPAHWDENAQDYYHDSADTPDCFMIRKA